MGLDTVGDATAYLALVDRGSAARGYAVGGAAFTVKVSDPTSSTSTVLNAIATGAGVFTLYFEVGIEQTAVFSAVPAGINLWTD